MSDKKDINDTTVKLYIGGIDPDWSSDKIKDILAKHGDVIRVDVVKNFAFAVSSYLCLTGKLRVMSYLAEVFVEFNLFVKFKCGHIYISRVIFILATLHII